MTARVFRVVLEFVDDFADHDHPSQWRWSALLDQPDVRLLEVTERPAPEEAGPLTALTSHAIADACGAPHKYLCLTCGAAWCHDCDPAPAGCCHYCHGRGYSTAEITTPAMREPCPGCDAEPREPCRPDCLSHVTDSNGQPLKQCHACGSTASRWLDCEACPAGECPERVCIDCGASVGN